jgi:hypothetical protein
MRTRSSTSSLPPRQPRFGYDDHQGLGSHGYLAHAFGLQYVPTVFHGSSPVAYKAALSDPDTMTFEQAMADREHQHEWLDAMQKEISSFEALGTWDEVDISDAKTKIIPGTWVLRCKRSPDGEIKKRKARYCCRGDLQEGDFDTFAPVVAWTSVRLFLVLSMTIEWVTCSIDFSNAFLQAELVDPVWIHLPRGFHSTRPGKTCLRLKKSQYGLSIAPRLWFEHLSAALTNMGLTPSTQDKCLLFKRDLMVIVYVDDVGLSAPNMRIIDEFIAELENRGFVLTREGTFSEFLGIKFEEDKAAGTITLTQKGLIKKVIAAAGLEDSNPNWTPAATKALGIDPDGKPMAESWNYPSIVGMLLYLSTNTRPDISFAVSQVARFNHNPKQSHAQAIKMILRYLKGTADKGMIVKPCGMLQLDDYADADFCGLFRSDPDTSPTSAKSRTGFIITLSDVPLVWRSQLQSEISLSTLEAEYSALSQSLRTLLPLRTLLIEVAQAIGLDPTLRATIHCRAFQDNQSSHLLATTHRITNRTKYFLVKWHWFWHHVDKGHVDIDRINTLLMRADGLTKGLVRDLFEKNRKLNQGW